MALTDVILVTQNNGSKECDSSNKIKGFTPNYARVIDIPETTPLDKKLVAVQDETSYDRHLIYIHHGSGSIKLEDVRSGFDKNYNLQKGDRILLPNDIAYTLELANGSRVFKFGEKKKSNFFNMYESGVF